MRRQNVGYDAIEEHAGPKRAALKSWRARSYPSLDSLEAALGYLGWTFVPVPTTKALDPALVAALEPVAEHFALTMPQTTEALIAIVTRIQGRLRAIEAQVATPEGDGMAGPQAIPSLAADPEPLVAAGISERRAAA